MEGKNKQNQKEKCPLCKVSEEAIERLKKEKKKEPLKEPKLPIKKKSSWKFLPCFLIFLLAAAGLIFYQINSKESPIQEQLTENIQANISETISKGTAVGDLAPDFISEDVYGNTVSLSDFQDKKPVLLVFWATWCGYCAKELPDLKVFTSEHQNEIQVMAISSGESKETIRDYIQEKDVNFLMLLDEEREIWNEYLVRGTPSHFLISSQGKIAALRPGLASKEELEILMTMLTELW